MEGVVTTLQKFHENFSELDAKGMDRHTVIGNLQKNVEFYSDVDPFSSSSPASSSSSSSSSSSDFSSSSSEAIRNQPKPSSPKPSSPKSPVSILASIRQSIVASVRQSIQRATSGARPPTDAAVELNLTPEESSIPYQSLQETSTTEKT